LVFKFYTTSSFDSSGSYSIQIKIKDQSTNVTVSSKTATWTIGSMPTLSTVPIIEVNNVSLIHSF
jgi:hypothetical protein